MSNKVILRPTARLARLCGGSFCQDIPDESVIVVLGDSIVDAQLWSAYVESYFHLRYPTKTFHIRAEGRGGSTLSEVIDIPGRYERRVIGWEPDIVIVAGFGHNGSDTAAQYLTKLTALCNDRIVTQSGATAMITGPQPSNTSTGQATLGLYADQITAFANGNRVYADVWHAMQPVMAANLLDPTPVDLGYEVAETVHPGPAGHLFIAYTILNQMSAVRDVSSVTINATGPTLTSEHSARTTSIAANAFNGIDFVRKDSRLPMAFEDAARDVFELVPDVLDLNRYMLTVANLASGTYDVYIDGQLSATKTHTQLATGWNMTDMTDGPIYDQLQEVLGRIRDKEGVSRTTDWARTGPPFTGVAKYRSNADAAYNNGAGLTGAALVASLASVRAEVVALDALIKSAAQPVARTFSLRKQ